MRHARPALVLVLAALACSEPSQQDPPWTTVGASTGSADETDTSGATHSQTTASSTSESASESAGSSGTTETQGESTTSTECETPDPSPAWQLEHLESVVGSLAGELPIDGVNLSDRASVGRRALVATWLLAQYDALGIDAERHDYGTGTNIVATIPATGTSQGTFVLGAHYDSVAGSPGANDNATGVALITAAARYLAELPCRNYDVRVVAFDQEEVGLVGSAAYAAQLVADRTPVVSVHTIDQIGWDGDGDRVLELERPDAGLFEFYDDVLLDVPQVGGLTVTDTGFTDHVSFRNAGFSATGISEEYVSGDTTPHYHLPSDTYDTVDLAFTAAASTLLHRAFARAVAAD